MKKQFLLIALLSIVSVAMAQNQETITVNGVSFKMVKVEGGKFSMGATPEQGNECNDLTKPVHTVVLSDYRIGTTEVTQKLWKAVMGNNPSISGTSDMNCPVNNVSWNDCHTFIQKLNTLTNKKFRLPTEAEWEYAARGGKKSKHTIYAGSNEILDVAICFMNSDWQVNAVASLAPNELGIYDMSGNVSEWCEDIAGPYQPDSYGAYTKSYQTNPTGASNGKYRVIRGGSCVSNKMCYYRVSDRSMGETSTKKKSLGLRLVCSDFKPSSGVQDISNKVEYLYEDPTDNQILEWRKKYHSLCSTAIDVKGFTIPKEMKEKHPCLVYLILNSKSLKGEEQSWFDMYSLMSEEKINKMYRILYKEKYKLKQIAKKK